MSCYDLLDSDSAVERRKLHPLRLVLRAEPQIGKTGTFLSFIHQLQAIILDRQDLSDPFGSGPSRPVGPNDVIVKGVLPPPESVFDSRLWQFPAYDQRGFGPTKLVTSCASGKYTALVGQEYSCDVSEAVGDLKVQLGTPDFFSDFLGRGGHFNPIMGDRVVPRGAGAGAGGGIVGVKSPRGPRPGDSPTLPSVVALTHITHPSSHRASCDTCRDIYAAAEPPVRLTLTLPARPGVVGALKTSTMVKLSVPKAIADAELVVHGSVVQAAKLDTGKRHALAYWIFTPSIRPLEARLNLQHAFDDSSICLNWDREPGRTRTAVHAVVCTPSDFKEFVNSWGNTHIVVRLPKWAAFTDGDFHVSAGVGYSRRVILEVALALGLPAVFQLDDLLESFMRVAKGSGVGLARRLEVVACSVPRALMALQRLLTGDPRDFTSDGSAAGPTNVMSFEEMAAYTGGADKYGVIGTARLRLQPSAEGGDWVNFRFAFAERHVYSATLVNVSVVAAKGITYPVWPFWEVRCFPVV